MTRNFGRALGRITAAASLVAAGAAQAQISDPPASPTVEEVEPAPYTILPGDRLGISVLEDPTLSRDVLVRPDGVINLPIAGSISTVGRTPEQLERIILSRIANSFAVPPTVTVSLAGLGDASQAVDPEDVYRVFFYGQVGAPGGITLSEPLTLIQALAVVGGMGPFAAADRVTLRRTTRPEEGEEGEVTEEIFTYDLEGIEDGEPFPIVELQDGDVIVVPERGLFD